MKELNEIKFYKLNRKALATCIVRLERADLALDEFYGVLFSKLGEYHDCDEGIEITGKKLQVQETLKEMVRMLAEVMEAGGVELLKEGTLNINKVKKEEDDKDIKEINA